MTLRLRNENNTLPRHFQCPLRYLLYFYLLKKLRTSISNRDERKGWKCGALSGTTHSECDRQSHNNASQVTLSVEYHIATQGKILRGSLQSPALSGNNVLYIRGRSEQHCNVVPVTPRSCSDRKLFVIRSVRSSTLPAYFLVLVLPEIMGVKKNFSKRGTVAWSLIENMWFNYSVQGN